MPKDKPESLTFPASASAPVFFNPKTDIGIPELAKLPDVLLNLIGDYLDRKELVPLAQADRRAYANFYPTIKAAMVKVLIDLVKQDDTLKASQLLSKNPNLLLRQDPWDPTGKAYMGIKTTPYQDALADVFAEEMRTLIEESFPGKSKEERFSHAALQAEEFEWSLLNPYRRGNENEQEKIMKLTCLAYKTYVEVFDTLDATLAVAVVQRVRDAWMRVGLVQDQWPKRLRKIFSVVVMDEDQTFKKMKRDLPEPHFNGKETDLWLPGTLKGCNFRLMSVPLDQNMNADDFRATLSARADGYPVLIRQGEGEEAAYHLYAPHITLAISLSQRKMNWRDAVEWQVVPVNDPDVTGLIQWGRPMHGETMAALDFNQQDFPYNPAFDALYCYGAAHSLHLGSGCSYIFSASNECSHVVAERGDLWGFGDECARENLTAVIALYKKRKEHLHQHLDDLKHHLPRQSNPPNPVLGK